jgi:hypothetical protein
LIADFSVLVGSDGTGDDGGGGVHPGLIAGVVVAAGTRPTMFYHFVWHGTSRKLTRAVLVVVIAVVVMLMLHKRGKLRCAFGSKSPEDDSVM